jgi:hypothetical protein
VLKIINGITVTLFFSGNRDIPEGGEMKEVNTE